MNIKEEVWHSRHCGPRLTASPGWTILAVGGAGSAARREHERGVGGDALQPGAAWSSLSMTCERDERSHGQRGVRPRIGGTL